MSDQQFADERKGYSSFIWGTDLADMQLISNYNKKMGLYYVSLTFLVNMHGLFL